MYISTLPIELNCEMLYIQKLRYNIAGFKTWCKNCLKMA